ncbi:hypothetical protein QBC35DRAFT_483771 [Podospora australis]|uniref:Uncharacterized protein n=1 Tax=Podospora australis TaxID=1536484 RepID=A0AAN6X5E1_9PEZI|nr:hypothetical protein QBC35DRAFT_483771 [Podospora australis]
MEGFLRVLVERLNLTDGGGGEKEIMAVLGRRIKAMSSHTTSAKTKGADHPYDDDGVLRRDFMAGRGFTRIDTGLLRGEVLEGGEGGGKRVVIPTADVLTVPLSHVETGTAGKQEVSEGKKVNASGILFGIVSSYDRVQEQGFAMVEGWAQWLSNLQNDKEESKLNEGDGGKERRRTNGAGLILALEKATPEQVIEVRDQLWRGGMTESAVFAPEQKGGDSHKGSTYAQLFQRLLIARHGKGEMGAGKTRRWFGVVDDEVFLPSLGRLLREVDTRFEEYGEWYVGLPSRKSHWIRDEDDKGKMVTHGGGAVLLSPSVLDTVGQLMCFQEGGKGGDDEHQKPWGETLYKCLEQDEFIKLQVLLMGAAFDPTHSRSAEQPKGIAIHRAQPPLVIADRTAAKASRIISDFCGNKKDCFHHHHQQFIFADNWRLVSGHSITHYPGNGKIRVEAASKKLIQQQKGVAVSSPQHSEEGAKIAEKIVIHHVKDGGVEEGEKTIVWKGGKKKKTWRLLNAEAQGEELWQAYINRRHNGNNQSHGDDDDGEEKSDVDSVIILIWEK